MRQDHRIADLLVGMARVDPQAEVHLDGLIEFGGSQLFHQADRLLWSVELGAVDLFDRVVVTLAVFGHWL